MAEINVRETAYRSLLRYDKEGAYSNIEVSHTLEGGYLTGADRALYTALTYGVIERKITLDYFIEAFARPIDKIEPKLRPILRMGLYQILYMDRIPDSAACNESVKLAKRFTHAGTAGFVNGVLRSVARRKDDLPYPKKGSYDYLSVFYGYPTWLVERWCRAYGEEQTERLLIAMNEVPPLTLRVNTLRTTREALIAELKAAGIDCLPTEAPHGVRLTAATPIGAIEALRDGRSFVQDEASQRCVEALGAKAGETVLDLCACPGGKSFGIALSMGNEGKVQSYDLRGSKLSLIEEGARRLGITCITAAEKDSTVYDETLAASADRVLCDVPCSGLGVIAKKPDLRHKAVADIDKLPEVQYRILRNGARYLKAGGTLVYSTCTLNGEENEKVISRFLEEHREFSLDGMTTLFPHKDHTDGFFICRMKK